LGYDSSGRPDEVDYAKWTVVQQKAIIDLNDEVKIIKAENIELRALVKNLQDRLDKMV
jgi:hypothetical protein